MYLDDGLGIEQDQEMCKIVSEQVKLDLVRSGFVPKAEKSLWEPTKRLVWLESSIEQLQFWKLYISEVNVKHFSVDESCHSIIYSDASDTGFGGYIVEAPQNIAHGMWVESERSNSSTWKELSAAYESEINFLPPALHTNVDVLMDLLCESKADSTVKTYHAGFIRWKKWAVYNDIKKYGLHSLRSGGATTCANLGISDRLFKRHGRWRSETAKDGYIKDSLKDRLIVSENLGL
ncbi:Hypothetical predicted protein [Mytilus galloprovincialis]|uniref:Uncharacterized protein n=1 Tax=Mytilus galloprovincialis TaxID=29158 RepID=A0A8B6FXM2_MYTGA|nr:Hypothetical predicted protein [Mytilus galloprovincialis]